MILEIAALNNGRKPIWSEIHFLDWYDGPMSGVGKLDQSDNWYAFNSCYYDTAKEVRVFSVIEQTGSWATQFITILKETESVDNITFSDLPFEVMREAFLTHTGTFYLMSARGIEDVNYTIVQAPLSVLKYADTCWENMDADEAYIGLLGTYLSDLA